MYGGGTEKRRREIAEGGNPAGVSDYSLLASDCSREVLDYGLEVMDFSQA
jgi:hypothetical protein